MDGSQAAAIAVSRSSVQLPSVPYKVNFDKGQIFLRSVISEGDYGCVYRGIFQVKGSKGECAAKCCLKTSVSLHRLMFFRREAVLHARVSSGEGVASLYDIFEDESFIWIIMKYYPEGDLWNAIVDGHFRGQDELIRIVFSKVISAVAYCHSNSVYHRDLKPENILLDENRTKPVLADFGLSSGVKISGEMRCGSSYYMSPESWGGLFGLDLPYENAPHDIWSLGVVLFNMICRRHAPWKEATNNDPVFRRFLASPRSVLLQYPISLRVCNLLERVFKVEPKLRITLKDFRSEINKIKIFTRPLDHSRTNEPSSIPRVPGVISYPFRMKSRETDQLRLMTWVDDEEFEEKSFYSMETYASTDLSHCCISSSSSECRSESVVQLEGPTVRLVGNDDPLYNARPVLEGKGLV